MRSVWLPIVVVMLMSLLNLTNSYTAFRVIISLSTLSLYQSYSIAIACMLHARLTHRIDTAPWPLPYDAVINSFASVYSLYLVSGLLIVTDSALRVEAMTMRHTLGLLITCAMLDHQN